MFNAFEQEVGILSRVSHPNIVKLLGFVENEATDVAWLVMSWEQNGNLREFLATGEWDIPERISLLQDVAEGLAYLHTEQRPICHGDLKSENILISNDCHAIITDFGCARAVHENLPEATNPEDAGFDSEDEEDDNFADSPTPSLRVEFRPSSASLQLTGPVELYRWLSPEVARDEPAALPSDIWALGWLCWETITDTLPFSPAQDVDISTFQSFTGNLRAIRHDHNQLHQTQALCDLMTDCWKLDPLKRPRASGCRDVLNWMSAAKPAPTTPNSGRTIRSATFLVKLGETHLGQSHLDAAESAYHQAVDIARRTQNLWVVGAGLLGLADISRRQSLLVNAERHTAEALQIFAKAGEETGVARSHSAFAKLRSLQGKNSEAEQHYRKALEIYTHIEDQGGTITTLEGLGDVCLAQLKLSEAAAYLSQAIDAQRRIGNDLGQANTLMRVANIYRRLGKIKEAEALLSEASNIFTRVRNLAGRANALVGLASIRSLANGSEAAALYLEATQIYERLGDNAGMLTSLSALGELYRTQAKFSEAEASYARAQEICARTGNELGTANALVGLGVTYKSQHNLLPAEDKLKEAIKLHDRLGDSIGKANALNGLGDLYLTLGMFPEAEGLFSKAIAISDGLSYEPGRGTAYLGLGISNRAQGNYPATEGFFVRALDVYTRINNVAGKAQSLNELGQTYVAQGRYNEAEMCYSDALAYFRQSGQGVGTASTLLSLGHVSMARIDFFGAEEKLKEAKAMFTLIGHPDGKNSAEKYLAQIQSIRHPRRGRGLQFFLIISCLGAAFTAWSAMQRGSWMYTLRSGGNSKLP
ncbi:copper transport protein ctr1 [Tulasnella sp. 427]|nr:copper transport protein ctr1 [Tulasnella sp. 427]